MKKWLPVLLVVVFAVLPSQAQVKIGFINSITGTEAPIGEHLTNGVKLAIEDLDKRGIKVQLFQEDDTGKPEVSMSAMEKLATQENVAGVVGPYSSKCANAVSKRAEQYKVPLLVPAASKEEITRGGLKWVFRLSATTLDYASVLLDMALTAGKPQTIAIISESTDFGTSGSKAAKEYAEKKGLKVVFQEDYQPKSPDYRATLTKAKAANPDIVFLVSYVADAILLMRQSREIGLTPQAFLGAGAGYAQIQFAKEKDISNNVFSSTQWTEDVKWPGAKDFFDRYKAKFGKEPTYHAACAYASMVIMAEEATKAKGDREALKKALVDGKWTGIMGPVAFDDYDGYTNQNKHEMLAEQVQNGEFVTVWPPKYAAGKPVYPFPGWK